MNLFLQKCIKGDKTHRPDSEKNNFVLDILLEVNSRVQ